MKTTTMKMTTTKKMKTEMMTMMTAFNEEFDDDDDEDKDEDRFAQFTEAYFVSLLLSVKNTSFSCRLMLNHQ